MSDDRNAMQARLSRVTDILKVDVCTLYRAHPKDDELEILASCGLEQGAIGSRLRQDQGLTGKVARTGKPVAARNIQDHPDHFHVEGSGEERFRSYLGIPLEHDGVLRGVLVIQTTFAKTFFRKDIGELHAAGRDLLDEVAGVCTEIGQAGPGADISDVVSDVECSRSGLR